MIDCDDYCYECQGYGDECSYDDNGESVSNCDDCWVQDARESEEE